MKYLQHRLSTTFSVEKLVTVHYFELSPHFQYPPEAHDFWEFHYVDRGSAFSISDKERILLNSGDILFHPPMTEHQIETDGVGAPNVCVVSFSLKGKELPALYGRKLHLNAEERGLIKKFLTEAGAAFDISHSDPSARGLSPQKSAPEGALQMMRIHLEELLILMHRRTAAPLLKPAHFPLAEIYEDSLVNDMVLFMQENVTRNLTIADFCKQFNYGKTHICTRFVQVTGKSVNRYFTELKIRTAKRLIREQSASRELFSRISDLLGFSSPSYFYSTFKRITGRTPSEYCESVHQYDFDKKD